VSINRIVVDVDEVRIAPSPHEIADALVIELIRDARAGREALRQAIRMIAKLDQKLELARAENQSLRDELRRYIANFARRIGMEHSE
jgi:hypothetical protein